MLDCNNSELIEYAKSIANGVGYYYPNAKRESAILENKQVSLAYALTEAGNKQVSSLKSCKGDTYLENTMDIFVRMKSGNVFYASDSEDDPTTNLYRFGYYFYQARFEGLDNADKASAIRCSQQNKAVEDLLASLGDKKHELLHVHYGKH